MWAGALPNLDKLFASNCLSVGTAGYLAVRWLHGPVMARV
jgi:hypothetical protein